MLSNQQFVSPTDRFIYGTEKNNMSDCYHESNHMNKTFKYTSFPWIGNRSLLQWLIISEPGHNFLYHTLENMVELIRAEYIKSSILSNYMRIDAEKSFKLLCITGPGVFTASIYEVLQSDNSTFDGFKYAGNDFLFYYGQFKAKGFRRHKWSHYTELMNEKGFNLLREYKL